MSEAIRLLRLFEELVSPVTDWVSAQPLIDQALLIALAVLISRIAFSYTD